MGNGQQKALTCDSRFPSFERELGNNFSRPVRLSASLFRAKLVRKMIDESVEKEARKRKLQVIASIVK